MNVEKEFFNRERKCPVCKKAFIPTVEWVYKRGAKIYCRYKCFRADEKPTLKADERRAAIMDLLLEGKTTMQIAQELGIECRSVIYWKDKLEKEGMI